MVHGYYPIIIIESPDKQVFTNYKESFETPPIASFEVCHFNASRTAKRRIFAFNKLSGTSRRFREWEILKINVVLKSFYWEVFCAARYILLRIVRQFSNACFHLIRIPKKKTFAFKTTTFRCSWGFRIQKNGETCN